MKIAVIDDGLHQYYIRNIISSYHIQSGVLKEGYVAPDRPDSHGTICASIIQQLAGDVEFINIKVMKTAMENANIMNLVTALELCKKIEVDIISMSVGTTQLSDAMKLEPLVKELHEAGKVMVAALSNENLFTYPACFDHVWGVICDADHVLHPGECLRTKNKMNVDLIANCDITLTNGLHITPSNSYAVPVAVAKLVNLKEDAKTPISTEESIQKAIRLDDTDYFSTLIDTNLKENPIPRVCFVHENGVYQNNLLEEIIVSINEKYQYSAIGIGTDRNETVFIKACNAITPENYMELLDFYEQHANIDLIFLLLDCDTSQSSDNYKNLDLIVSFRKNSCAFSYEQQQEVLLSKKATSASITKKIIRILS